jgi:hypothetical protein
MYDPSIKHNTYAQVRATIIVLVTSAGIHDIFADGAISGAIHSTGQHTAEAARPQALLTPQVHLHIVVQDDAVHGTAKCGPQDARRHAPHALQPLHQQLRTPLRRLCLRLKGAPCTLSGQQ